MKHTVSRVPGRSGVELMQAVFTLLALSGIYTFSTTYGGSDVSLREAPQKPAILSSQYWSDKAWYGFSSAPGDKYAEVKNGEAEQVDIHPWDGLVYDDQTLRVSFFSKLSIEDIEAKNTRNLPRTYSRLPGWIAMIEWDLSSPRAKTVLATLHSR